MGRPGQFVVVSGGTWTPYRVSTLYLPTGLLAGPAAALRNIRARPEREVWLICEGGALIDLDQRRLLWYGAEPVHPEWLTAAKHVLACAWPGWHVRWACDGVREFGDHIGLTGYDLVTAHAFTDHFADDRPQPPDDPDDPVGCLVTVGRTGGAVTAHAVDWPAQDSLLAYGPELLDELPAALPMGRLPVPVPLTALHIDPAARQVTAWGYEVPRGADARWPGWRLEFRGDRFAEQNAVCGAPIVAPLSLDWAYQTLRRCLVDAVEEVPTGYCARMRAYYGDLRVPGWDYRPEEVTAALTAVDAAARSTADATGPGR
ncbi:hypothetical protein HS048_21675 [Planomonospora sp. ID91781]|uniref:hypothetical protein n=1 Tax=Planomonospora sp. ID91781 TaxID=2738135 RepID=UPI0018C3FFE2|nr:hypothetical protein [Planomonospora sp. ID91781]MBG0823343.1 hypothetical protein [Planomonospora sp. ID91781]